MRIVSVPGRLVRDPVTRRPVDTDGLSIDPTDLYWARLLADGDVVKAPDLARTVTPVVDDKGTPVDPPAGDLATDIASPGTIAAAQEQKA